MGVRRASKMQSKQIKHFTPSASNKTTWRCGHGTGPHGTSGRSVFGRRNGAPTPVCCGREGSRPHQFTCWVCVVGANSLTRPSGTQTCPLNWNVNIERYRSHRLIPWIEARSCLDSPFSYTRSTLSGSVAASKAARVRAWHVNGLCVGES